MNRTLAQWLVDNPGPAVAITALLGMLPIVGIGLALFLCGAVPALLVLVRGPRIGASVAVGASLLLAASMLMFGRPLVAGIAYAAWVLGPALALAWLLERTGSLSLCLQVAVLVGSLLLVGLHVSFGDPEQFWAPFVRDFAQEMKKHGLPETLFDEDFTTMLARTLWGWVAVLTMLIAMCALFLARWWQSLPEQAGRFGAEFREVRLGKVLGVAAAVVIVWAALSDRVVVGDIGRLFLGALVIVGLAVLHRVVATGRLGQAWLWIAYLLLVVATPLAVIPLAAWGFVDNWLRSQRTANATPS